MLRSQAFLHRLASFSHSLCCTRQQEVHFSAFCVGHLRSSAGGGSGFLLVALCARECTASLAGANLELRRLPPLHAVWWLI